MKQQLYLDMDGVLADFDGTFQNMTGLHPLAFEERYGIRELWKVISTTPDYFYNLAPMGDVLRLLDATAHLSPIVLTGIPGTNGESVADQKKRWIKDRLPEHHSSLPVITCLSRNKRDHCKPGDVLVDDRMTYRHLWEEAGGTFILHTSADGSIADLMGLGLL